MKKVRGIYAGMLALVMIVSSVLSSGCQWNKTAKGGTIGAAAGGAIGGVIGSRSDNTILGAIIGAAVGGAAGAAIGHYMDKQAEELRRDLDGAKVERVGEGIKITFDSGILFDIDKHDLKPAAKENIKKLSKVLQKYKDTNILIEGHTDNTGSDEHNQSLSERRASAVSGYLVGLGVDATRATEKGYGETQPVADNASASGRQMNRRVDVAIMANKKLQNAAKKGDLEVK